MPEKERLKLRQKAGYTWTFPNEPENYKKRQEQRWVEIQALDHYQERLDNFVQYTQVRTVPNYTKNGFDVVDIPHDLWQRMRDRLHEQLPKARTESEVQGIYGSERPRMVGHGEGRNLLSELQPILEKVGARHRDRSAARDGLWHEGLWSRRISRLPHGQRGHARHFGDRACRSQVRRRRGTVADRNRGS